jgi:hypothetical protein
MTKTWQEDLMWYATHQTTEQIGFNPDGMCLKVCRTPRDIPPLHATAKQAQDATPKEHRFFKVRDLRKGMKLYFDDPFDSNSAGHIVTMIGRVRGGDLDSLDDVLVETNSVKSGELVVVRASYFREYWGDSFQFGTDFLNGVEFDFAGKKKLQEPEKDTTPRVENFRDSGNKWNVNILDRAVVHGRRNLEDKIRRIEKAVHSLPKDDSDTRVSEFKETFKEKRVLDMALLNAAVDDGRTGAVKAARDELRAAIKSVLRH